MKLKILWWLILAWVGGSWGLCFVLYLEALFQLRYLLALWDAAMVLLNTYFAYEHLRGKP